MVLNMNKFFILSQVIALKSHFNMRTLKFGHEPKKSKPIK